MLKFLAEVLGVDKIAIISDIHGNIPALEAVLDDIQVRGISRIFCLGDMIGKGPHPHVAVDIVKDKCEEVVRGNWDDFVAKANNSEAYTIIWNQKKLGNERMEYLKNLPTYIEFFMSGRLVRLCHATVDDVFKRIQVFASTEEKMNIFKAPRNSSEHAADSDIVGYGDIHYAYIQNHIGKTLFNVGSVGNPLDTIEASYAIIEGKYGSREKSSFAINFVRVPYDIENAVYQAESDNIPELTEYVTELRTGIYRGLQKK